jgi:hypothetical protein
MSEDFSAPSWELLPFELLEKIFSFVPKHMLNIIGQVCSSWKDAVHYSAVKLLMSCIGAGQLEEKQIERFGWRTSAAWDHDNDKCSCIDLAFNFFLKKSSVLVHGISPDEVFVCNPATMSDKVFYMDVDTESKVFLRVIDRLDAGSQPQNLELPVQTHEHDEHDEHALVACDNLLAVLIKKACGILKVFLWNRESETWLADLDISHFFPKCYMSYVTMSRNLLALTVSANPTSDEAGFKSLFWRLDTKHPDDSSPQFLGIVTGNIGNHVYTVTMNEKWIVLGGSDGIRSIEKTRLFSGDQNHVAVEAQQVNPELPQNPWQAVKLNDMDYTSFHATLEPGSSNRLGIVISALDFCDIFKILNLATGETVFRVPVERNLFPVRWLAGNFYFIMKLQSKKDKGIILQVVVFDPSRSRGSNSVAELEKEEDCLLSGTIVNCFGATAIPVGYHRSEIHMIHIDYFGLVLMVHWHIVPPTLFIASF